MTSKQHINLQTNRVTRNFLRQTKYSRQENLGPKGNVLHNIHHKGKDTHYSQLVFKQPKVTEIMLPEKTKLVKETTQTTKQTHTNETTSVHKSIFNNINRTEMTTLANQVYNLIEQKVSIENNRRGRI